MSRASRDGSNQGPQGALAISDKFTRNGVGDLRKILKAEGYSDIVLGQLHQNSATLSGFWSMLLRKARYFWVQ